MALMTAGNTKLLDPLKDPLGGYANSGQGSLADALGRISNQGMTSARVSRRPQGQYMGQALGQANTMASRGINDAVGGVLGGASLKDAQAEKEFQAQMALANEIGSLNSPSTLQEILSGLGGGANTGAQFAGLYKALGKRGSQNGPIPEDFYNYSSGGQDYGYF